MTTDELIAALREKDPTGKRKVVLVWYDLWEQGGWMSIDADDVRLSNDETSVEVL